MAYEQIVFAGKSGAGCSTTAVNISAALAEDGYRIVHCGYDCRGISTAPLRGNPYHPVGDPAGWEGRKKCVVGYRDILCIEAGAGLEDEGADLGEVCRQEAIIRHHPDFVIHDISGDPETILSFLGQADESWRFYAVTSADFAAMYFLNDFVGRYSARGERCGRFGGIIANNIAGPFFESVIGDFARQMGARLVANIPRSLMVLAGDLCALPLVEVSARSHMAAVYRKLARSVSEGTLFPAPRHMADDVMAAWSQRWREIIAELEGGIVRDGAAI